MLKRTLYTIFNFLVVSILITGLLPVTGSGFEPKSRLQPELANLALRAPDMVLSVIIQEMPGTSGVKQEVAELGGQVTRDLDIIHAVAAEMSAGAALRLRPRDARRVRWRQSKCANGANPRCRRQLHRHNPDFA